MTKEKKLMLRLQYLKWVISGFCLLLLVSGCGGEGSPGFDDSRAEAQEDNSSNHSLSGAVGAAKTRLVRKKNQGMSG